LYYNRIIFGFLANVECLKEMMVAMFERKRLFDVEELGKLEEFTECLF
jgi:hypothetical protein